MNADIKDTTANLSLFDYIRRAANELRGSGLTDDVLNIDALDTICQSLQLSDRKEAAVIAIFAAHDIGPSMDIGVISSFLGCSDFDARSLTAALLSLTDKGYLRTFKEDSIFEPQYRFANDIFEAIVENREVHPKPTIKRDDYDQFKICSEVHKLLCERKHNRINTETLFCNVTELEDKHADLEFIIKMKEELGEVKHRIIVYDLCNKYVADKGDNLEMRSIFGAIYDTPLKAAMEQKALRVDRHPLLEKEFVTLDEDDKITADDHMLRLLYGDAAEAFIDNVKQTDRYSMVKAIDNVFNGHHNWRNNDNPIRKLSDATKIERGNVDLSFVKNLMLRVPSFHDRLLFYMLCNSRMTNDDFQLSELDDLFAPAQYVCCRREIMEKTHPLQKDGLIELCPGNMADDAVLALTESGEALFFEDDIALFEEQISGEDIVQPDTIVEKRLFFDDELEHQLTLLGSSLHEDKYQALIEKLTAKRMPTGVCALLYGHPGTGKTESVMQLARETGRTVMHVDISQTKSCWFGESEKTIKRVFARYRKLCKKSKLKPILLFNEADGVLSKRKDATKSNVAQTENAMQNIILEEMEKLDGIMIATTNLANNLDSAFERRFLFKVHFDVPTLEAKRHMWMDKMPLLSKEEATMLAQRFPFSGGEIDNVVRKAEMEELLSGETPSIETIIALCSKEKLGSERCRIGF